MKILSRIFTVLVMVFLYAPILVMIVFSFNAGKSTSLFSGFSFHWYAELFRGGDMLTALGNSLSITLIG